MTKQATRTPPSRTLPVPGDEHYQLYKDVREAISSLPIYFRTETRISGIMATDLHTLNSVLGATIEEQVVRRKQNRAFDFRRHPLHVRKGT